MEIIFPVIDSRGNSPLKLLGTQREKLCHCRRCWGTQVQPQSDSAPLIERRTMDTSISVFAEIPEDLHASLTTYLDKHPHWDSDRVFSAALSLFLLQNEGGYGTKPMSPSYKACARVYLETLFQTAE